MADTVQAGFPNLGPKVAATRHPIYDLLEEEWIKLGHVREGTGGFKDGTYLVAHPREWLDHTTVTTADDGTTTTVVNPNPRQPSAKLKARRKLARYENLASAILETKKSALFREAPTRRVGKETGPTKTVLPLEQWWANIDGKGTHIDDALPAWWDLAATFGHVALYFELPPEKAPTEGQVQTAADDGWPYVRVYTPLDIINWLADDNGAITSIKVQEAIEPTTYEQTTKTQYRVRIIDEEGWRLYDFKTGAAITQGEHGLGRLPVVWLFGKRRAILSDVGQSVLGDPRNYIDVYNLTSEKRELERNQTFSFINLPLGSGPDAPTVEQAQAMMGKQSGTMNLLFSALPAQILSADAQNVETYQADIQQLKRDIYREAGVQWETDSKDAEAEGSLSLKREEMNTRLSMYADECEMAEYGLADCFYRWKHGDRAQAMLDADEVTIAYPERFDAEPFEAVLQQVQAAQAIGMPTEVLKALRKAIVTKFEGMSNLPPDQIKEMLDAIDAAEDDLTPQQVLQKQIDAKAGGPPKKKAA